MKRFVILALGAVLLALPGNAAATHGGTDCTYAQTPNNSGDTVVYVTLPTGGDAAVYDHNTDDQAGATNEADQATGACVNAGTGPLQGGTVECGAGVNGTGGKGEYCVIDGDNQNADPLDAYVGVSNYEGNDPLDTKRGPQACPYPDSPPNDGANSGQCLGVGNVPQTYRDWVPGDGPDPICGSTSGNNWDDTIRDGCSP
jgi:hypothetical protein